MLGNIASSQDPTQWPADHAERGQQCSQGLEASGSGTWYPVVKPGCHGCCRQGSDLRTDRPDEGGECKQTWLVGKGEPAEQEQAEATGPKDSENLRMERQIWTF